MRLIDRDLASSLLPKREKTLSKWGFGKVFVLAGSDSMPGAGILSSLSALRSGAGYVYLICDQKIVSSLSVKVPELLYLPYKNLEKNKNNIIEFLSMQDKESICILSGPGLGTDKKISYFFMDLLNLSLDRNFFHLIDADGLNIISSFANKRFGKEIKLNRRTVLTPHIKESYRLLGISNEPYTNICLEKRLKILELLKDKYEANIVLKGYETLCINLDGEIFKNSTGNSSLAKAGSGDVLSGIIAGFCAQKKDIFSSALFGVYLHGLCADIYTEKNSEYTMLASDLLSYMPEALRKLFAF